MDGISQGFRTATLSGNPGGFSKHIWKFSNQLCSSLWSWYSQGHGFISTWDSFLHFLQLYFPSLNMLQWIDSLNLFHVKETKKNFWNIHSGSNLISQILYSQTAAISSYSVYHNYCLLHTYSVLFTITTIYSIFALCQTHFYLILLNHKPIWLGSVPLFLG